MDDSQAAVVAHALGHPARVRILRLLAEQDTCRGADLFAGLPLAQSPVSQHLGVLKRAGLVNSTRRGTSMLYCISASPLAELRSLLDDLGVTPPVCTREDSR